MEIVYEQCAGLDVHKKTVVACVLTLDAAGQRQKMIRTFSTMTGDLLALSDWLTTHGVTHVAMESTGEFWKPIYNLLETSFTVLVVNAQHIKHVPGRKTDVKDAEWIANLLRHGLVRGSFIPPLPQRDLRDLTRQRTLLVQERTAIVNRLQKVLEWANLKLASVATDILGVSARAMLEGIAEGETDSTLLAGLARGRLRVKRDALEQALQGMVRDHHRFMITQHLLHIDFLDEQIQRFEAHITQHIARQSAPPPDDAGTSPPANASDTVATADGVAVSPVTSASPEPAGSPLTWEAAVTLLDTIPGIGRRVAEIILAEIGPDMDQFPTAEHLASWAKVCPGNHESAGKRHSGKTGTGNPWLRSALIQAAHAAVKQRDSWVGKVYRRLVPRLGVKKAIVAIAHRLVIAIYHMLRKQEAYREPAERSTDETRKRQLIRQLQQRLEALGAPVAEAAPEPVAA
jgi:transposase